MNANAPTQLAPKTIQGIPGEIASVPVPARQAVHDTASAHEVTLDGPPVAPAGQEGRFLRAVLKEDGTIHYRMKTRQRLGAKYLMKEVFD